MAKHFVILITSLTPLEILRGGISTKKRIFLTGLTVLILFVGCKPEPIEQPQVQPLKTEILKPEPSKVEPPKIASPKPEPPRVEPNEVTAPKVEPQKDKPTKVDPVRDRKRKVSNGVEPNEVKPAPKVSFHDKCAGILNEFVDDKGIVNYKKLRRKRPELNKLLDEFAKLDPNEYNTWAKEDKIAFWINAYNIKMLKVIVNNHPIESTRMLRILWGPYSIRHIDKKIGGIWRSKFIVMGEEFTLSEIDQRFFRKEFDEARVFLAITHASLSSPPLRNEPYYGCKLGEQLGDQAKRFLSSRRAFRIDREKTIVYLSAILKSTWHGNAFVSKYGTNKKFKDQEPAVRAVLNFITNYISKKDLSFLELKNYTVKFLRYDWTINDGP